MIGFPAYSSSCVRGPSHIWHRVPLPFRRGPTILFGIDPPDSMRHPPRHSGTFETPKYLKVRFLDPCQVPDLNRRTPYGEQILSLLRFPNFANLAPLPIGVAGFEPAANAL